MLQGFKTVLIRVKGLGFGGPPTETLLQFSVRAFHSLTQALDRKWLRAASLCRLVQQHAGAEPETARGHLAPKLPRCGGSLLVLRVWGVEWRSSDDEAHEEAAATTGTGRRLRQRGGSNNDDGLLLFSCVPNPRRI